MIINFLFLISLISASTTASTWIQEDCSIAKKDKPPCYCSIVIDELTCYHMVGPQLRYDQSLENITIIHLAGTFQQILIDPKFHKLKELSLQYADITPSVTFNFADYKDFPLLEEIRLSKVGEVVVGDGVEKMNKLQTIELRRSKVNATEFLNLNRFPALIHLKLEDLITSNFDLSLIPTDLVSLYIYGITISEAPCRVWARFHQLSSLTVMNTELSEIDLSCLPPTLTILRLLYNYKLTILQNALHHTALRRLDLESTKLETFNVSVLPSTIKYVSLYNNEISSLTCRQVNHLTELEEIHLYWNKLTEIDIKCFPDNLYHLDLARNQISKIISLDHFKRLSNLSLLYMNENSLEEFDLAVLNENIPDLDLSLYHNRVTNFKNLEHLLNFDGGHINLQKNPISCSCSFLVDYVRLMESEKHYFWCTSNTCVECSPNSDYPYPLYPDKDDFSFNSTAHPNPLEEIERLDADHNACLLSHSTVSPEKGRKITFDCTYEFVYDMYGKIACLNYESLQYYTTYRDVESVDFSGTFSNFSLDTRYGNIAHIKLRSNNLTTFHFSSVGEFTKLRILDLSNNRIKMIGMSGYVNNPNLQIIDLNNNEIIDANISFNSYPILTELRLSHNKLTHFDINLLPLSIRKLDLSHNSIATVTFRTDIKNYSLPHFTLDLSANSMTHLNLIDINSRASFELVLNDNNLLSVISEPTLKFVDFNLQLRNSLIECDCEFYTIFTTILADSLTCTREAACFKCRNNSSLINYPWYNRTQLQDSSNKIMEYCTSERSNLNGRRGSNGTHIGNNANSGNDLIEQNKPNDDGSGSHDQIKPR